MGYQLTSRVWEHARAKGSPLIVLLALAEWSNDDTGTCWYSVDKIAVRCRMSERNVQYCLKELEALGDLEIEYGTGRNHASTYHIRVQASSPFTTETVQAPAPISPERVQRVSPFSEERVQEASPIETERVQPCAPIFLQRVQTSVIKGANQRERVQQLAPKPEVRTRSNQNLPSDEEVGIDCFDVADVMNEWDIVTEPVDVIAAKVERSYGMVPDFNRRDGPLQAHLCVAYYTSGKGAGKKRSDWYSTWLNWIKKAVSFEQADDRLREISGTPRSGGAGGDGRDPDIERRGYDYDEAAGIRAVGR